MSMSIQAVLKKIYKNLKIILLMGTIINIIDVDA